MSRVTVLALILSAASGLRVVWHVTIADSMVESPSIPFASFPLEFAGPEWQGEDVPLSPEEEETAGVTAYLQRSYTSGERVIWLYVGFVGGGTSGAIHAPEYCMPATGYELRQQAVVFCDVPGLPERTRWKENLWTDSHGAPVYSLHTFYFNGRFEPAEWRLRARRVIGVPYFAILNITGNYTGSLEETRQTYFGLIEKAVPLLLRHLP